MWKPEPSDFEVIKSWGLEQNPFAGPKKFDISEFGKRWRVPGQIEAYEKYVQTRKHYISGQNFQKYYLSTEKPIDRLRWDYLRLRKAYYITPLGWEDIFKSSKNLRILDLGCGDGDVIQNFMEFASIKLGNELEKYQIKIIGADLSESRLLNAKKLVNNFGNNIEITFVKVDLSYGIPFDDGYFDAVLCTGVLEILEQDLFLETIDEICRISRKYIYIEDLFEKFPGGYPRTDQGRYFMAKSFVENKYILTFTEPISENGLSDPMKIWPIMAVQNSFYIKSF